MSKFGLAGVVWSRRRVLFRAAAAAGGAAVAAMGTGAGLAAAQGGKIAPALARYQETPKGKAQCATCASFLAPEACKVVTGTISPTGWCMLYAAKR
jgi:hypothetical protein